MRLRVVSPACILLVALVSLAGLDALAPPLPSSRKGPPVSVAFPLGASSSSSSSSASSVSTTSLQPQQQQQDLSSKTNDDDNVKQDDRNQDVLVDTLGPDFVRDATAAIFRDSRRKAFQQQTPHSGRHFRPSHASYQLVGAGPPQSSRLRRWTSRAVRRVVSYRRRFMEGWYYRLTLPDGGPSFAIIASLEDAQNANSQLQLSCLQIVGPDDTYLVQADRDTSQFWAARHQQALGCTFQWKQNSRDKHAPPRHHTKDPALSKAEWEASVESGFQVLPTSMWGRIDGHDGTRGGVLPGQGVPGTCEFDFTVEPVCGWGSSDEAGISTGGWLSHFSVFEPHWQVTVADAWATGRITWQNQTYHFDRAKFYAEKNWGAALPVKWYWTQCNSFEGRYSGEQLSVTAGGGIRGLPLGKTESLGMIGVHYRGVFYEAVPWTGTMEWNVTTWGSWVMRGNSTVGTHPFEVEVTYTVDPDKTPGLVFRAPTPEQGMVYFCRDTFEAETVLTLWELERTSSGKFVRKAGPPLIDGAYSSQGGAEIGGGPWWDTWQATSQLTRPIRLLLRLPLKMRNVKHWISRRRGRH